MAEEKKEDQGSDLTAAIQALLGKHNNDASAAINQLLSENFNLREKNRKLKDDLTNAEKAKPAEGALVLSKADAEKWEAYKVLGKPEEVKTSLAERDTLKIEVTNAKRDELLRTVAEVEGWNYSVVKKLAGDVGFEITEIKDDKGETKKIANVVIKNGDKTETKAASAYAEAEWKDFLPSLKVGEQQEPPRGTQFVKQAGPKSQPATKEEAIKHERQALVSSGNYGL